MVDVDFRKGRTETDVGNQHELFMLIYQASHSMIRALSWEMEEKAGLTFTQATVIFAVKLMRETPTPAAIARWLFRERNSVTRILRQMEEQGLVSLTRDLEKKNMIRVSLTEKAESSYRMASQLREDVIDNVIMASLTPEEYAAMWSGAWKLRATSAKMLGPRKRFPFP